MNQSLFFTAFHLTNSFCLLFLHYNVFATYAVEKLLKTYIRLSGSPFINLCMFVLTNETSHLSRSGWGCSSKLNSSLKKMSWNCLDLE